MKLANRFWFIPLIMILAGLLFLTQSDASLPATNAVEKPAVRYTMDGIASWYSKQSPGIRKHTANNEVFDDTAMTCAMWGAGFNQMVRVTNKANGKSVVVRVNDRGPHARFVREGRIIDLTRAAFSKIAHPKYGLIEIQLEFL